MELENGESAIELLHGHLQQHLGDLWEENRLWKFKNIGNYRGIFATRDIDVNEVILKDIPLVVGPSDPSNGPTCVVCLKKVELDCLCSNGCSLSLCERCANSEKHKIECDILRNWRPKDPKKLSTNSMRTLAAIRGLALNSDSFELIDVMQQNLSHEIDKELINLKNEFEHFPSDPLIIKRLRRIIAAIRTNAFKFQMNIEMESDDQLTAYGLYPLCGFLNHKCTPNTRRIVNTNFIQSVIAARKISKGVEIFTTYTQLVWCTNIRRMHLAMTKQFLCTCERCSDRTENGSFLNAMKCPSKQCTNGITLPIDSLDFASDWICMSCKETAASRIILKSQDFAASLMRAFWQTRRSHADFNDFLEKRLKKLVPECSQYVTEMKLSFIWKFKCMEMVGGKKNQCCRLTKQFLTIFSTENEIKAIEMKNSFIDDILDVLDQLNAGECVLKQILNSERVTRNGVINGLGHK